MKVMIEFLIFVFSLISICNSSEDFSSIWVSSKVSEMLLLEDSSMTGFSFELNGTIHKHLIKIIYSHADETYTFHKVSVTPTQLYDELVPCYGRLWKWWKFMLDVYGGIGIAHSIYRGVWLESNRYLELNKTSAVYKIGDNIMFSPLPFMAIGEFFEIFTTGFTEPYQSGLTIGLILDFGYFKQWGNNVQK